MSPLNSSVGKKNQQHFDFWSDDDRPERRFADKSLVADFSDQAIIGAWTVLDAETVQNCLAAGAKFIVSPVFNLDVIETCRQAGVENSFLQKRSFMFYCVSCIVHFYSGLHKTVSPAK